MSEQAESESSQRDVRVMCTTVAVPVNLIVGKILSQIICVVCSRCSRQQRLCRVNVFVRGNLCTRMCFNYRSNDGHIYVYDRDRNERTLRVGC